MTKASIGLENLKRNIAAAGVEEINDALNGTTMDHVLRLKDSYSVTFEDPLKPSGTSYKRLSFAPGAEFELASVRKTDKNFIFQFKPFNDSAIDGAKRHSSGAGLAHIPTTAEFTMAQLKDERMNATSFLTSIKDMLAYQAEISWTEPAVEIDRGNLWGSW